MNYTTAVFLINKDVRAIVCTYEVDSERQLAPRTTFKSLDKTLKVDDYVLVPTDTRHKMTVCKVVEVDVDVDFDSSTQMAWIIGKVDRVDFEKISSMEGQAIAAIKSAEKLKKRNELRDALLADSAEAIKLLPISTIESEVLPTPPPFEPL